MPTWPVVAKIVEALDGDVESMRALWVEAREPLEPVTTPSAESEVRVFVSYARIDDQATYGRISKLISDIASTYESMTGKTVGVFIDVDSIKPGDDWRDRIKSGLSYSSIFLAFISPAYLRSPACREELNEFLAFLTASSVERLVIPLIYTKIDRIENAFSADELWQKVARREYQEIGHLRSVDPGSSEWIETTELLADRVEETLSSFTKADEPSQTTQVVLSASIPPGTLERMAALEDQVPQVLFDMARISTLMTSMNEAVVAATPKVTKAKTFKDRLSASRALAKKLDPIADEMAITAERLVTNFSDWDYFVKYMLDYAKKGGELEDPEFLKVVGSLWSLSQAGGSPLATINDFAQTVSRGIGVSRDLDRPFMSIRDAAMRIADMSGILDGWKEGLEALESEYLEAGRLDRLAEQAQAS